MGGDRRFGNVAPMAVAAAAFAEVPFVVLNARATAAQTGETARQEEE